MSGFAPYWNVAWAIAGWLVPLALLASSMQAKRLWHALAKQAAALLVIGLWLSGALQAAEVRIPEQSAGYRFRVEHCSAEYFGIKASPARLAAQLHQESLWQPSAQSAFAHGLAQFVPATAKWLPEVCPELGFFDPWDANQSICAAACYGKWLDRRVPKARGACDRAAFVLSAYNGGLTWLQRDVRLAESQGADPTSWFGSVDQHSRRATWAIRENRSYVERILLRLEPAYIKAGWEGTVACP